MYSTYSRLLLKPNHLKKALVYGLVMTVIVGSAVLYPPLLLAPLSVASVLMLHYNISFFQKLKHRRIWLTAFSLAMAFGPVLPAVKPADAAFSFLFQTTEQVFNTCVLAQFATVATISAILFGALRVSFMVGIGVAGYQIWQRRQQSQDWQEVLNIMLAAVMIVIAIGFVEPFVVGTGAC